MNPQPIWTCTERHLWSSDGICVGCGADANLALKASRSGAMYVPVSPRVRL